MAEKCPICYNDVGTYTDDPMKTPLHFNDSLRGICMQRERHITEIQDRINEYEAQFGVNSLTTWTPTEKGKYPYRGKHINEIREAIEGVLVKIGVSLSDFLSQDENGNLTLGITDWLDGHRLLEKQIVRAMHVEEIRKKMAGFYIFCTDTLNGLNGIGSFNTIIKDYKLVSSFHSTGLPISYYIDLGYTYELYLGDEGFLMFNMMNIATETWEYNYSTLFSDSSLNKNNCQFLSGAVNIRENNNESDFLLLVSEYSYKHTDFVSEISLRDATSSYNALPFYLAKYSSVRMRQIGVSSYEPNQTFLFSNGNRIIWNNIKDVVTLQDLFIYVDNRFWHYTADLYSANSFDKAYTFDLDAGKVIFGNGINGLIPPLGAKIYLRLSLKLANYNKWIYEKNEIEPDTEKQCTNIQPYKNNKVFVSKTNFPISLSYMSLGTIHSTFLDRMSFSAVGNADYVDVISHGRVHVKSDWNINEFYGPGETKINLGLTAMLANPNYWPISTYWGFSVSSVYPWVYTFDYTPNTSEESVIYNNPQDFILPYFNWKSVYEEYPLTYYLALFHNWAGVNVNCYGITKRGYWDLPAFFMLSYVCYNKARRVGSYYTYYQGYEWKMGISSDIISSVLTMFDDSIYLISISDCPDFSPILINSSTNIAWYDGNWRWSLFFNGGTGILEINKRYGPFVVTSRLSLPELFPKFTFLVKLCSDDDKKSWVKHIYGVDIPADFTFDVTVGY